LVKGYGRKTGSESKKLLCKKYILKTVEMAQFLERDEKLTIQAIFNLSQWQAVKGR